MDRLYEHAPTKYNWADFEGHNQMWRSALGMLGDPRFAYLDVSDMTAARPDGHCNPLFDCLPYCLPGVIIYWNFLLFADLSAGGHMTHQ